MKRTLLSLLALAMTAVATAQPRHAPSIIYDQPAGTMVTYLRSGKVLREDIDGYDEATHTAKIDVKAQDGFINIVFGTNRKVYMQDPVSNYVMAASWVEGTLSDDGTTITVPLGQYVDYTRSFDMAYQLKMVSWDEDKRYYLPDDSYTEVTYTVSGNTIALQGTSQQHALGLVIRTFGNPLGSAIGQDFSYLNNTWTGDADFESVYTVSDLAEPTPPAGLANTQLYANTAASDGMAFTSYSGMARLGITTDGQAWLQGINSLMPTSWIVGTAGDDGRLAFAPGQYLGTYAGVPIYMMAARLNTDGSLDVKDLEFTFDGQAYTTTDLIFASTSASSIQYIGYFMGLTLAYEADRVVEAPADAKTFTYDMDYQQTDDDTQQLVDASQKVVGAIDGDRLFLKGVWPAMPDAWVVATIDDGEAIFSMPQYLGQYYDDESASTYDIYFTAYDTTTGRLLPRLTFDYDASTRSLSAASAAVSIGICKTGYLSVQDYISPTFTDNSGATVAVSSVMLQAPSVRRHTLMGTPASATTRGIVIENGRKVMK